jgi:hypothetical protein
MLPVYSSECFIFLRRILGAKYLNTLNFYTKFYNQLDIKFVQN